MPEQAKSSYITERKAFGGVGRGERAGELLRPEVQAVIVFFDLALSVHLLLPSA